MRASTRGGDRGTPGAHAAAPLGSGVLATVGARGRLAAAVARSADVLPAPRGAGRDSRRALRRRLQRRAVRRARGDRLAARGAPPTPRGAPPVALRRPPRGPGRPPTSGEHTSGL